MEVVRRVVLCCLCVVGLAATCEADGFFRRVPEVGEWARYDLTMKVAFPAKPDDAEFDVPAMVGSLTFRCVGEETIDDVRNLWLEARMDIADPDGTEHFTLIKLLVPADQIVEGDLTEHAVRAWCAGDQEEVRAMDLAGGALLEEPAAFAVLNAFPASRVAAGRREARTITIDGEDVQLAAYETGDLPSREFDDADISGDAIWWPSADHAFGIAAAELRWIVMTPAPEEMTMQYTSNMNLVETGTDAESELPDNN